MMYDRPHLIIQNTIPSPPTERKAKCKNPILFTYSTSKTSESNILLLFLDMYTRLSPLLPFNVDGDNFRRDEDEDDTIFGI